MITSEEHYRQALDEAERWRRQIKRAHEELKTCGAEDSNLAQALIAHVNRCNEELRAAVIRSHVWAPRFNRD